MKPYKERIEEFRNEVKVYVDIPKNSIGGQQCVIPHYPTVIEHENLEFKISIGYYKSNHKNKDLGLMLFNLFFDEVIK